MASEPSAPKREWCLAYQREGYKPKRKIFQVESTARERLRWLRAVDADEDLRPDGMSHLPGLQSSALYSREVGAWSEVPVPPVQGDGKGEK